VPRHSRGTRRPDLQYVAVVRHSSTAAPAVRCQNGHLFVVALELRDGVVHRDIDNFVEGGTGVGPRGDDAVVAEPRVIGWSADSRGGNYLLKGVLARP
jgi:hypothetical protein